MLDLECTTEEQTYPNALFLSIIRANQEHNLINSH